MGWFKREHRANLSLSYGFNISAIACVVLPLLIFLVARLGQGGGGGGEGWWREEGAAAGVFVYVWSLLVFACLVWYGNEVLSAKTNGKGREPLLAGLMMFANLALLCAILLCTAGDRGGAEELGRWLGQFSGAMILTFVLWFLWSAIYSFVLNRGIRSSQRSSSTNQNEEALV